jgi:peroxiredoxin
MFDVLATLTAAVLAFPAPAEDKPLPPKPGATVPDFSLKDIHRRSRTLAGFKDKKAFVVVFVGTECPLANLYLPTLIDLHKTYGAKGVQFLAINSNSQDSFVAVSAHAQERDVPFPMLKDFDHKAADAFGAKRTPEVFLLDADRVIRYRGRIDDQYAAGAHREQPTRRDLQEALDELLAGKPVSTPETVVDGCIIGRAKTPRVPGKITYAKDVAPILQNRCQECHRPGEVGPMSLLTYDKAKAWADTISEVVLEERMPPWYADPGHGKFKNDRHLTKAESDTLLEWVSQGCPKGDEKDLPPPAKFVDGWTIGKPDAVFKMDEEFKVPANGVLPYKEFTVDPGFTENKWVVAMECRPGNRAVVHHILVYLETPGKKRFEPDGTTTTLVGWAPGDMPAIYPTGAAKLIPKGSKLIFEVHYTPNGKEEVDRSSVGLIFAKRPPENIVDTNILANMKLSIPAGAAAYKDDVTYTFPADARLLSFMPHMHLRGVSAKYVVTYPDGKSETLLSVPDYDFGWQSIYRFAEPRDIPKGTKLTFTARWDNSSDNPRNPDAKKEVRWGLQTWDEMQNGWMEVVWKK